MRMKVSGLPTIEFRGEISGIEESDGHLCMGIRLSTPLGWSADAALTHKDLMTIMKEIFFKPRNLFYLMYGFAKTDAKKHLEAVDR